MCWHSNLPKRIRVFYANSRADKNDLLVSAAHSSADSATVSSVVSQISHPTMTDACFLSECGGESEGASRKIMRLISALYVCLRIL